MQTLTPEQISGLAIGATPAQIVILVLLGAASTTGIFLIVVHLIKFYTAPVIKEIEAAKEDREILRKIEKEIVKISASLWSKEYIQEKIESAVNAHALECPFRTATPERKK